MEQPDYHDETCPKCESVRYTFESLYPDEYRRECLDCGYVFHLIH